LAYDNLPPEWNDPGTEPPQSKKDSGYQPGDKPPAQWINWFFNRAYKALAELQGKSALAADLDAHTAATTGVHGATSAATPNTIAQRDANGCIQVAAPSVSSDAVNKNYVDSIVGTPAANANTLVRRDAAGRAKFAAPSASDDVARKAEVDAVQTNLNTHKSATTLDHPDGSVTTAKLANGAVTPEKLSQQYSTAINAAYNEDPNTTDKAYILTNHANAPIGGTFWHIRTFFYSSLTGNRAQIAIRYSNTDQMFIRRYNDGVWAPWVEVMTADRGFFNTDLVLPNGKGLYVRDTNGNVQIVGAINNSNIVLLGDADLPVEIRGTTVQINGNTAWHAGNDGAGSGLDADMLDGLHASSFLQTAGGTVSGALAIDGNLTANGGENRIKNLIANGGYFEVESYGSQYGSGKLRTYFDANNRRWVLTANIGGTAQPLKLDLNGALLIADNGSPEGSVAAPLGSIYLRLNGSAGQVLYVKTSGTGNTGWQAIA